MEKRLLLKRNGNHDKNYFFIATLLFITMLSLVLVVEKKYNYVSRYS